MAHVYRWMSEKVNNVIDWTTTCNTEITVFITVASAPCGRVYPGYAPTAAVGAFAVVGQGGLSAPIGRSSFDHQSSKTRSCWNRSYHNDI